MTDQANVRRKNRPADAAATNPEVADLRSRLVEQGATIEGLRHNVEWLSEELVARDEELELALMDLAVTSSAGEDDTRIAYRRMTRRLRRLVQGHVPRESRAVIVTGGDETLLRLASCKAEHLSQDRAGGYIGFPKSSRAAVVQLEAARWRGADALVIPQSGLWWLQHYADFARHLDRRYAVVVFEEETGAVWDLRTPSPLRELDDLLSDLLVGLPHQPVILDWHTGHDLAARFTECNVFSPADDGPQLPYLDGTIDVVAVPDTDRARLSEAQRVAAALVVAVTGSKPVTAVDVIWRSGASDGGHADVSVVVASKDGRPSTPHFLRHLLDTLPSSFTGEVVVDTVSDAVIPRLGPEAARLKRIRAVRSPAGAGFAGSVRRAAEAASGDVLVVLDGATWPVAGWLPPLVHLLRHTPRAGVATGMLVEPDGRLVLGGTPFHIDKQRSVPAAGDDDLEAPCNTCVRCLDVAPSALFAAHRQRFLEYPQPRPDDQEPAAALCARVRSAGMTVLYQPETVAISCWPERRSSGRTWGRRDG